MFWTFQKFKKGRQKGGAAPSGHPGILGPTSKKWEILVFPLYRYENERGAKGGARKRGAKGGAAFPNVGSDQIYHNMRL